jgi:hypothetical protein
MSCEVIQLPNSLSRPGPQNHKNESECKLFNGLHTNSIVIFVRICKNLLFLIGRLPHFHFHSYDFEDPGGSMRKVVGLPYNSCKPITNKRWVRARLCKLQKRCTRLAAASDTVYQFLAQGVDKSWY